MRNNETCYEIHGESRWMGRAMRSGGGEQRAVVWRSPSLPGPGSRSRGEGQGLQIRARAEKVPCVRPCTTKASYHMVLSLVL